MLVQRRNFGATAPPTVESPRLMPNALASETSLYLRQHADNPVDWQPWSNAVLARARQQDQPILLSIGYSACHWCHVMAHESFEDETTGALMNRLFVNIKVDREERPDLDRIYQLAHQALTRRGGGWPLTLFLDPHTLVPFYAGTYFPPKPRHGLPSFTEVLTGVRGWWDEQREQITEQNSTLQVFLAEVGRDAPLSGELDERPALAARTRWLAGFDAENGGHLGAPKFPHAGETDRLLALARQGDAAAGEAAATTLARMASRGLYDHLGGGFFRYCVDERWDIPHFEKMLYDNALLLPVYAAAARQFNAPTFRAASEGIVTWLQAQMRADDGGFCSAIDADSEGVEGKFYLWDADQIDEALAGDALAVASQHYGLNRAPNFEAEAWHLHAAKPPGEVAASLSLEESRVRELIGQARTTLLAVREKRIPPARDDKTLTAWNALLCTGLARAGQALHREDWIDEAVALVGLLSNAMNVRGRLPAVLGRAGPGFLDDHAFALQAALTVLEVRWSMPALQLAIQLAETLLSDFVDGANGGFFFTANDHEALPQRPKPWLDDSTPSGNAVAAASLATLGYLLAEPRYLVAAENTLRAAWSTISEQPQAAAAMLAALDDYREPLPIVVIRGEADALASWRDRLTQDWHSPLRVFAIPDHGPTLPPGLAGKPDAPEGRAALCVGTMCLVVCETVDQLIVQLRTT